MNREKHTRSTVNTWGISFMIANLLILIGQVYWIWRYATNHYLCIAAVSGDLTTADIALKLGASPNYHLPNGETPLTLARHPVMVVTLLSAGADPNVQDNIGATPLFTAVERGDKQIVKILLQHGAAVNKATDSGVTPLMIAARDGRLDLVRLLLSHGADATVRDRRGFTAIDFIKKKNGTEYRAIESLLRQAVTTKRNSL